jgi:hypothetical protein
MLFGNEPLEEEGAREDTWHSFFLELDERYGYTHQHQRLVPTKSGVSEKGDVSWL